MKKCIGTWVTIFILSFSAQGANLIYNGGFDTGDFSGWTQFTTIDGRLTAVSGWPDVRLENVSGGWTWLAEFQVERRTSSSTREGGGIYQSFVSPGGLTTFGVDIYGYQPFNFTKPDAGVFDLYVDGALLSEYDFLSRGPIGPMGLFQSSLGGQLWLDPGAHEIRILMRSSALDDGSAPFQFLDNISAITVPEPASIGLWGLICATLITRCSGRRRRGH